MFKKYDRQANNFKLKQISDKIALLINTVMKIMMENLFPRPHLLFYSCNILAMGRR